MSVGFQSKQLIVDSALTLGDVDQYPTIDVTIDGADEYASLSALYCDSCLELFTSQGRSCVELC